MLIIELKLSIQMPKKRRRKKRWRANESSLVAEPCCWTYKYSVVVADSLEAAVEPASFEPSALYCD